MCFRIQLFLTECQQSRSEGYRYLRTLLMLNKQRPGRRERSGNRGPQRGRRVSDQSGQLGFRQPTPGLDRTSGSCLCYASKCRAVGNDPATAERNGNGDTASKAYRLDESSLLPESLTSRPAGRELITSECHCTSHALAVRSGTIRQPRAATGIGFTASKACGVAESSLMPDR